MTATITTLLIVVAVGFAYTREMRKKKAEAARERQRWLERERAIIDGLKVARSVVNSFPDAAGPIDAEISSQLQRISELG